MNQASRSAIRRPKAIPLQTFANNMKSAKAQEAELAVEVKKQEAAQRKKEEQAAKDAITPIDPALVDYLHHAAGKNGLALPGMSESLIRTLVQEKGVRTVNDLVREFYRKHMDDDNFDYHEVTISDFILAMGFDGIVKSNVKEFATGIFKYLISDDLKDLSQLKGKRLSAFLDCESRIRVARLMLVPLISNNEMPQGKTFKLSYTQFDK